MVFVYFDTCVWISAFLSRDINHPKAVAAFEKVKHGDYTVLVTHHVLSEILDFLKKEAVVSLKDERKAELLTREGYAKFSIRLLRMPNVVMKNPNAPIRDIFHRSFLLLFKYLRGMLRRDDCPVCHSAFSFVQPDTIFLSDALHATLAWALNCDLFLTFDKDFSKLANEHLLSPMKIDVQ